MTQRDLTNEPTKIRAARLGIDLLWDETTIDGMLARFWVFAYHHGGTLALPEYQFPTLRDVEDILRLEATLRLERVTGEKPSDEFTLDELIDWLDALGYAWRPA